MSRNTALCAPCTPHAPRCKYGVCKYYIGPIGDLSLLTASAAAAARVHSLHRVIKIPKVPKVMLLCFVVKNSYFIQEPRP